MRRGLNRRKSIGVVFAVVALVATGLVADAVIRSGQTTYGGFVAADQVALVDFTNAGTVSEILVKAGQKVSKGQVMAIQSGADTLASVVADDKAAVKADEGSLAQLQDFEAAKLSGPAAAALVEKDQAALAAAQATAKSVNTQSAAAVTTAQASALTDSHQLFAEQATALSSCSSATSYACVVARRAVTADQNTLSNAQAAVASAQAAAKTAAAPANAAVATAQTQLNAAERTADTASGSSAGAQVAAAQAELDRDQADLVRQEETAKAAEVVAPAAGVVTEINGVAGALAGPGGVRQIGLQTNSTEAAPAFSLSPSASGSDASGGSDVVEQPLFELSVGPADEVIAEVPEGDLTHVSSAASARVSVAALGLNDLAAHFVRIDGGPQELGGAVAFDVVFALDRPGPASLLPGLSVDVSLHGHRSAN